MKISGPRKIKKKIVLLFKSLIFSASLARAVLNIFFIALLVFCFTKKFFQKIVIPNSGGQFFCFVVLRFVLIFWFSAGRPAAGRAADEKVAFSFGF